MENKDPIKSINAILDDDVEIDGYKVNKLSLGRYAILELLDSPFINTSREFSVLTILPTVYAMVLPIKEIAKYNKQNIDDLVEQSFVWSEEKDIKSLDKFVEVIMSKFGILNKAAPNNATDEGDSKKKVQ